MIIPEQVKQLGRETVDKHMEDREHPAIHFERVAAAWSAVLGQKVTALQVCDCMIELKKARENYSHHSDNLVDIAGYEYCKELIAGTSVKVGTSITIEGMDHVEPLPNAVASQRFVDINVLPVHPMAEMARLAAQHISRYVAERHAANPQKIVTRADIANIVLGACEVSGVQKADGTLAQPELPQFIVDQLEEVMSADKKHSAIRSIHQGYGILLEEVDEFWDWVRRQGDERDMQAMRHELVQIASTAQRIARLMEDK